MNHSSNNSKNMQSVQTQHSTTMNKEQQTEHVNKSNQTPSTGLFQSVTISP